MLILASVACASVEIEPSDIAPVLKRRTMTLAGSTSSSGIGPSARARGSSRPRSVNRWREAPSMCAAYSR